MPFDYEEVARVTGRDYVDHLIYDGTVQMPYKTLKANMQKLVAAEKQEAAPRRVAQVPEPDHADILVVDDEVAVNNNVRKTLSKTGYRVDQAVSRDEALERIANRNYRLVLLDLRIPGVKGLELLESVMDKNPDAKVIMITGYASIETAVAAARMGAVDYLPKPFTPEEIRNATERAFQIAA
jgi:ActR/RegA family two-component response regulator